MGPSGPSDISKGFSGHGVMGLERPHDHNGILGCSV